MDPNSQHVKSIVQTSDNRKGPGGSKKRLRYASSRQRAKHASADVYRNYKRHLGTVTSSAATREEQVHTTKSNKKRKKVSSSVVVDESSKALVSQTAVHDYSTDDDDVLDSSTFSSELDVALDRNASIVFGKFYRELWPIVRSLPEILHHASRIVDILLRFVLSNQSAPEDAAIAPSDAAADVKTDDRLQVNLATTDILHLLGVLARDLRHEIHPHVPRILKRLLRDLLCPPKQKQQSAPLDVTIVEAVFRNISYIFRYDAEPLIAGVEANDDSVPCLESLRQFYSQTLANRRDLVRRLAAESFAPLIRKLTKKGKKKHLRRVVRALAQSAKNANDNCETSAALARLQQDAVDGISLLCFEVSRGVAGRMHGKGEFVLPCILDSLLSGKDENNGDGQHLVFILVKQLVNRLLTHLNLQEASKLGDDLVKRTISFGETCNKKDEVSFRRLMQLCHEVSTFANSKLLKELSVFSGKISHLIKKALQHDWLMCETRVVAVELMCCYWKAVAHDDEFATAMQDLLPNVLTTSASSSVKGVSRSPMDVIMEDLLPWIPVDEVVPFLGSAVLEAAATDVIKNRNISAALDLIHSIASVRVFEQGDYGGDEFIESDDTLFLDNAVFCKVSDDNRNQLLDACLARISDLSTEHLDDIYVSLRVGAFLAVIGSDNGDERTARGLIFSRVAKSFVGTLRWIEQETKSTDQDTASRDLLVLFGVALDSLAKLSHALQGTIIKSAIKKCLEKVQPSAAKYLLANPCSMWALKGLDSYILACEGVGVALTADADEVFEALIPNLRDKCHFRRLHTLNILNSFPKKTFIVDHADLDMTDDLDEEPSETAITGRSKSSNSSNPSGPCDLLDHLLKIETSRVEFANERHILFLISNVEMLGRAGRMPIVYSEVAASHLLGILSLKFFPLWKASVCALVAICTKHEDSVWPHVHAMLAQHMNKHPYKNEAQDETDAQEAEGGVARGSFVNSVLWEANDTTAFDHELSRSKGLGFISRHQSTDDLTILKSVWEVVEAAPQVLVRHSRSLVPLVLEFFHFQYFAFHSRHPDIREVRLINHVNASPSWYDPSKSVDRRGIELRLRSILKTFSMVRGPEQLFKHELLFRLFTVFVGDKDTEVAELALSCVLRYKMSHVAPYGELFKRCLSKGKLRDALLEIKTLDESDKVGKGHRTGFLCLLSRLLLGRLLTHSGTKSSKDSPSAKRTAVLSFLANISRSSTDLYPFLYLTIRSYLPTSFEAVRVEDDNFDVKAVVNSITSATFDDFGDIPISLHIGFLNMLGTILSQLGHLASLFLPAYVSLTLNLCQQYQVRSEQDHVNVSSIEQARAGSVRSECYQILGELFTRFDMVDVTAELNRLECAIATSFPLLQEMCSNAEKAPSLLLLIRDLSSKKELLTFFSVSDECFRSVASCINVKSCQQAMEAVLTILENLLVAEEAGDSRVISLHIDNILAGFENRISASGLFGGSTARRELDVLCRTSELIAMAGDATERSRPVAERIWQLLIPYLRQEKFFSDEDKLSVIRTLIQLCPQLSSAVSVAAYGDISSCLGPSKFKPGITAKVVRVELANLLSMIADSHFTPALPACSVLTKLCSVRKSRVDEIDQDAVVDALNGLENDEIESSWNGLCCNGAGAHVLSPIVETCFHLLHSDDGIAARASFKALKTLVAVATKKMAALTSSLAHSGGKVDDQWRCLFEGTIVRLAKDGVSVRNESPRRFFVLLIAAIARNCESSEYAHHYGDLSKLVDDNAPDSDFFRNITHVQIHRRTRAYQRLGKSLSAGENTFSSHSLSNVLLPLCLHPIYECKTKIDEPMALAAISTVGSISRHLSWSKYNNTIWTALSQLERHPQQERFLIEMVCSMLDNFHFSITSEENGNVVVGGSVWRSLEKRVIPKVESLMTKDKTDRVGTKVKILRPTVLLALLKLFRQFPDEIFRKRLPHLITVVCDGLKNKESDNRDIARSTLAKMVLDMDLKYLADVVRELALALTEGYQLHVRAATIHTILTQLTTVYEPLPPDGNSVRALDQTVAGIVDLIQQDLFGIAQERKEAEGSQVRYVKEAGGSKSANSLELLASIITFNPHQSTCNPNITSSVHVLVHPFFQRLRAEDTNSSAIRRSRECLTRIVSGLSRNPSVRFEEVLPFVFASVEPFLGADEIASVLGTDEALESDEEEATAIVVSGGDAAKQQHHHERPKGSIVEWKPSTLLTATSALEAKVLKSLSEKSSSRVSDGASAPKLTGSFRQETSKLLNRRVNDQASIAAILFGLQLLHFSLKRRAHEDKMASALSLDRFVPLLTTCVCVSRDNAVVLIAMKCLGILLRLDLHSLGRCSKSLATRTLELLTSTGASSANQELLQACFKMLSFLLNYDRRNLRSNQSQGDSALLFDSEQMEVLLSFLKASIVTSDHHNPALNLIKAIMARSFVSSEFYDLMETLLEQCVRNSKASLRNECSDIFTTYLLNYPMSEERVEQHLKRSILNTSYDYAEGRLSGIRLVHKITEKFPIALLEQHYSLIFLPLTVQLVNDESKECREQIATTIRAILKRASKEMLNAIVQYAEKWSQRGESLLRTAMQVFGLLAESRPDILRDGKTGSKILEVIHISLKNSESDWQTRYFASVCLEKSIHSQPSFALERFDLWLLVSDCLADDHPWVKLSATRILLHHVAAMPPESFGKAEQPTTFFVGCKGSLFQVARNLCRQLDFDEEDEVEELVVLCIKALSWVVQVMALQPSLCYSETEQSGTERDPIRWLLTRLSSTARSKGTKRRQAIFKCFAALTTACSTAVSAHLPLVLEALHRSKMESQNEEGVPGMQLGDTRQHQYAAEANLAEEVLQILEEQCDEDGSFIKTYAAVKKKALERKEKRKLILKTEAITNPRVAASKKILKQEREKNRRKRRVDDRRNSRSGTAKRRHLD